MLPKMLPKMLLLGVVYKYMCGAYYSKHKRPFKVQFVNI